MSSTQEELYRTFVAVSGKQASNLDEVAHSLASVVFQVNQMRPDPSVPAPQTRAPAQTAQPQTTASLTLAPGQTAQPQTTAPLTLAPGQTPQPQTTATQTLALAQTQQPRATTTLTRAPAQMQPSQTVPPPQTLAPAQAQQSQSTAPEPSTASKVQSAMEASQAGLIPLIIDLFGMFSGGSSAPATLVKYAMPSKINFAGADTSSGVTNADYGQDGMPRAYTPGGGQTPPGPSAPPAPQVTVNVQAMDSRSFMDRSQDIAAAVRDAMLNLNSINDVVNDL